MKYKKRLAWRKTIAIYSVNELTTPTVAVLELSTARLKSRTLYSRSEIRGAFGSESN